MLREEFLIPHNLTQKEFANHLNGPLARRLKVETLFGKELDSFSDCVSFGIAPCVLAYCFLPNYYLIGIIYGICAVFRLARFNILPNNVPGSHLGLASPFAACWFSSSFLCLPNNSLFIILIGLLCSVLMLIPRYYIKPTGDNHKALLKYFLYAWHLCLIFITRKGSYWIAWSACAIYALFMARPFWKGENNQMNPIKLL